MGLSASKLDLKQDFFQYELEPGSKNITTFETHMGLFRMKGLSFGMASAQEVFSIPFKTFSMAYLVC